MIWPEPPVYYPLWELLKALAPIGWLVLTVGALCAFVARIVTRAVRARRGGTPTVVILGSADLGKTISEARNPPGRCRRRR